MSQNESKTTNFTPEQIEEIEMMITNRIVIFHEALIERNQISPPSALSRMIFSNQEIAPRPKFGIIKND